YSVADGWRFYIDGVEGTAPDGTSCTTCSPAGSCPRSPGVEPEYTSTQHFALGSAVTSTSNSGTAAGFYAGEMDEARVWNVVRSAAQIQGALNQEVTSGSGLIGRWGFNEASGTSAADATTPAENGTLTQSATAPVVPANGPAWTSD